ncbi:hypothetical protein DNTS_034521 [Danionella cerebrum]|uniref:BHLH domain-containing protein n=1 Tax=Danionella cerebrum TaxID=2873325 RepID=A0A553MPJ7_9TELE|nr:hypothetical protein DNTS_034521 [Danionella translucida]
MTRAGVRKRGDFTPLRNRRSSAESFHVPICFVLQRVSQQVGCGPSDTAVLAEMQTLTNTRPCELITPRITQGRYRAIGLHAAITSACGLQSGRALRQDTTGTRPYGRDVIYTSAPSRASIFIKPRASQELIIVDEFLQARRSKRNIPRENCPDLSTSNAIMVIPKVASRRPTKRILKPVIEKKRRDRINQRLDELRTLLLDNTLDSRLQNPKLEKAEILELTVEYIRNKALPVRNAQESIIDPDPHDANPQNLTSRRPHVPFTSAPESFSVQMPNNPMYKAGFRECLTRLTNFIDCVEPSQRDSFVQGLCHHLDSYSSTLSQNRVSHHHPWIPNPDLPCRMDIPVPAIASAEPFSYTSSLYTKSFLPYPTGTHPYLSPPYSISPPPSPSYSSSSPPFSSSPTYLSVPCHFPFPPSISPLSSDSSSSTSSSVSLPAVPVVPGPHLQVKVASPVPHQQNQSATSSQPRTLRRALFQSQPLTVWRPW